jgi:two-component system NtrC family sensor kinase
MEDVHHRRLADRLRILSSSLGSKLFLSLFGVILVAFAVYGLYTVRSTSRQSQETVVLFAQRFGDLIKHSTHYGMLLNRKEDVHQIIRTIAREPGVVGVRIYDKQGVIMFSADSGEIHNRVDLQAEACVSCHANSTPLEAVPVSSRVRVFDQPGTGRVLGLINPIENAPECSNAACHAHPADQTVLGVLDIQMSMTQADALLAATTKASVIAGVLLALLAGLFSAVFILRLVRRPVRQLIAGAEQVAGGALDTQISIEGRDEIGQLASAFNQMTEDLRKARTELTEWSDRLETRLHQKTEELSRTQRQVVQMEKMASLGKLAATVAHELNNPLAGILNYTKLVDRTMRESQEPIAEQKELDRYLRLILKEASRSGMIVKNLLTFARHSGAKFTLHRLNPIIDRSIMLVKHHTEIAEIKLDVEFLEGNDQLTCDADQLEQALVALLVNAVEATSAGGTVRFAAEGAGDGILLTVTDTGVGIPDTALPHIFEPFFSSKEDAEGAGLGLSVVFGIVQRHGGTIAVQSEVHKGTTFEIRLPRQPRLDDGHEHANVTAAKSPDEDRGHTGYRG